MYFQYKSALWETFTIDRDTFIVYDNANIYVYLLNRSQIEGESVDTFVLSLI